MRRAIIMKNKLRFLDGSSPLPDRLDPSYEAWQRCNNLVHTWIVNSVSTSIAQSIIYMDIAATAWNDLQSRFSRGDRVRIAELQKDLASLQQNSLSISDYFTSMRVICEELDLYRPSTDCTCPVKCSCDAVRTLKQFKAEDEVIRFLMGLNENYAAVRSQILLMEPFPDINKVFSILIQHERQNGLEMVQDSSVLVNAVDGRKSHNGGNYGNFNGSGNSHNSVGRGRGNSRSCSFCGKVNHTVDTCYRKHGFPPGFQFRNGSTSNCVDATDTTSVKSDASTSVIAEQKQTPNLTVEEYQGLIALLKANTMKSGDQGVHSVNLTCTTSSAFNSLQQGCPEEDDWFW